jgi:hypothetical protein
VGPPLARRATALPWRGSCPRSRFSPYRRASRREQRACEHCQFEHCNEEPTNL